MESGTAMTAASPGADRLESYRRRDVTLAYHPNVACVEPTNLCNYSCSICPRAPGAAQGCMEPAVFDRLVLPELSLCPSQRFWLHFHGESLLHPELPALIRACSQKGFVTGLSTNGSVLDAAARDGLIRSGLNRLVVSLDAATAQTYRAIRGADHLGEVVANTLELIEAKRRAGSETPAIQAQLIRHESNEAELEDFIAFWNRPGIESVYIKPLSSRCNTVATGAGVEDRRRQPCFALWNSLVIRWDLSVTPCCADILGRMRLGSLKDARLMEIWNGQALQTLRAQHADGVFAGPCAACDDWVGESGFPGHAPVFLGPEQGRQIRALPGRHVFLRCVAETREPGRPKRPQSSPLGASVPATPASTPR